MQNGTLSILGHRNEPPTPVKRKRFSEPQKFAPIGFIVCTISFLFWSYVRNHCKPLVDQGVAKGIDAAAAQSRGIAELTIFLYLTTMLIICYVRCILVHPGEIPDSDPQWCLSGDGRASEAPMALQEMKKTGERRHCKWCAKYKPDRCHHCRVCKCCILKMDHHCPWIYNCVGYANYKFFVLLLVYSVLDTHFIVWTMVESVKRCIDDPDGTPLLHMFLIFFTETLAFFVACLVTVFFGFHVWLISRAMTTIEFCEKSLPKNPERKSSENSVYDVGFAGNFRAVLGDNPLFWLLPWSLPSGDGMNFMSDETKLTKDLESGRGFRRRTHQRTQRTAQPAPVGGSP